MDSFSHPESLRDRESIPFHEETRSVDRTAFESIAEDVDSHAVVGITNDEGAVLLQNDGSHGWTLLAFPAEPGADWTTVVRQEATELLGIEVVLDQVERVRRLDLHLSSDDRQSVTMYNVVFRGAVDGTIDLEERRRTNDDPKLGWFTGVSDEQDGAVADDIRRFVADR
ncbi:NUDIX domain-containing protein [Natrinema salaciae]|uniref:Uncharacterized protein n=1 Tax=Natrinema salaciae TaxID=1186196 RepID=A0A1H9R7E5_9EURY|nr:NUDIX domain-containing protein [Natrinema salaciae]SER68527.1 hypothetical protein SAMN04489841_4300 [Natrinema salaciae]